LPFKKKKGETIPTFEYLLNIFFKDKIFLLSIRTSGFKIRKNFVLTKEKPKFTALE